MAYEEEVKALRAATEVLISRTEKKVDGVEIPTTDPKGTKTSS